MIVATLALALTLSAISTPDAPPRPVPNPVAITSAFRGVSTTYSVSCWSAAGARGTWIEVTTSTYTDQEAVIYHPAMGDAVPRDARPSILYCIAKNGRPGIIQGAPSTVLLPAGSRVVVRPLANIMMTHSVNGKNFTSAVGIGLDDTTSVRSGPDGVTVRFSDHRLAVYPAGSTLSLGSGETVAYYRPGIVLNKVTPSAETGCAVTFFDETNTEVKQQRYAENCATVEAARPWMKRPR